MKKMPISLKIEGTTGNKLKSSMQQLIDLTIASTRTEPIINPTESIIKSNVTDIHVQMFDFDWR